MSNPKEPYRHELKYLIKNSDREVLKLRLKSYFMMDPHAGEDGYMIRSLYFDDMWDTEYEEKESGVFARSKYRIRIYNCSDQSIKLERKKKQGNYIFKESANLTREEVDRIIAGDYSFLLHSDQQLCKEFYVERMTKMIHPRVIVDYDRIPLILPEGTVRVTFDSDVRAAILSNDIFDPALPTLSCLEPGKCVMEVKFTEFMPEIIRDLIPIGASDITALSKYTLCYDKTQFMNGYGYYEGNQIEKL